MKVQSWAALGLAAALMLSGCGRTEPPVEPDFRLEEFPQAAASLPLQKLLNELQALLGPDQEAVSGTVCGSTGAAWRSLIQMLNQKPAMILAYTPSAAMRQELEDYGTEWNSVTVAQDALVMITGADNPVSSLTLDQLRGIYRGRITNWSEVGGRDEIIRIFIQDADSGLQAAFEKQVLAADEIREPVMEWAYERAGVVREQTAAFDGGADALGFTSRMMLEQVNPDKGIKQIKIEGIAASEKTLAAGTYPLTLPVLAATSSLADPDIARIMDWLKSDEGKRWLSRQGLVAARS